MKQILKLIADEMLLNIFIKFKQSQIFAFIPNFEQLQTFAPEQKGLSRICVTEGFSCLLNNNYV